MRFPKSTGARVAIAAALVGALYLAWRAWALYTIHGFIVSFAAVDSGRAVVCMHANDDRYKTGSRSWVGLLDARGGWVWTQKLDGSPITAARNGLLVHEGHVVVRTQLTSSAPGKTSSFALADGHHEWTRDFESERGDTFVDLVGAGPRVIQYVAKGSELVALEAANGTVAWRMTTGKIARSVRVAGPSLLWSEDMGVAIAPLAGGPKRTIASGPGVCIVGGEVVSISYSNVEAVAVDGKSAPRVVVPSLTLPEGTTGVIAARCGLWRTHPLFTVSFFDTKDATKLALVEIDLASGTQVRFDPIEIGSFLSVNQEPIDNRFPESAPLAGDLARFVPIVVQDGQDEALAVLDMESRKLARKGPASHERLFTEIVADHGVFYVQGGATREKELLRFDGATGKITAAVRLPNIADLRPSAIADGRIWVHSDHWIEPLPWAVLDATTLAPIHIEGSLRITPATDEIAKAWLGGS
jgi:hypothetical protein